MEPYSIFAPAKLNLFLAITGRRSDGFHDLVSVVVRVGLGDKLTLRTGESGAATGEAFTLTCSDPEVPVDGTNLVLKAAHAFAKAAQWNGSAAIHLEKRTPMGAGLGGGSSDAAATLRALNQLAGNPLSDAMLAQVAAAVGSDCPLFLRDDAVVMRGRGERVDPLPATAAHRLRGRRLIIFKPAFGIATAWAYRRLAEMAATDGTAYLPASDAEARLRAWIEDERSPAEALLFNNLERPAFGKHVALPVLLSQLRRNFRLEPLMTGSGSACFAFLPEGAPVDEISSAIRGAWGDSAWIETARVM